MSALNRLEMGADLTQDAGRGQLQETLDLLAAAHARIKEDLAKVKDSDKIVRPVPIEEFPLAQSGLPSAGVVGELVPMAAGVLPAGCLPCDGTLYNIADYPGLYAVIGTTWGATGGFGTFNTPDWRGRTLVSDGTGSGLTARTVGQLIGAETVALATGDLPAHTHSTPAHAHTMAHTHEHPHTHSIAHTHGYDGYTAVAGTARVTATASNGAVAITETTSAASTNTSGAASTEQTGQPSTSVTSTDGSSTSGSTGSGNAHANVQPSAVCRIAVRYTSAASTQALPVSWGRVNAIWDMGSFDDFPAQTVTNGFLVASSDYPEPVVTITGALGNRSSTTTLTITGAVPIPYNFREWKSRGLRILTRLEMTGVAAATTATVALRVNNPISAGSYLANTATRTITESGFALSDGGYKFLNLTAEDLGKDWRPGYALRFEIVWTVPRTFTAASLSVGFLSLEWR